MPQQSSSEYLVVAKIPTVYGVKGWVKIHSFTDPVDNFFAYSEYYRQVSGRWEKLTLDQCRAHGKGIVAHIQGVDDRDVARQYCGSEIAVKLAELAELADDEYYWHQLVGMKVCCNDPQGESLLLGEVVEMMETGANDVIVVRSCVGSVDSKERLIPYVPGQYVKSVSVAEALIIVDWDPEF